MYLTVKYSIPLYVDWAYMYVYFVHEPW